MVAAMSNHLIILSLLIVNMWIRFLLLCGGGDHLKYRSCVRYILLTKYYGKCAKKLAELSSVEFLQHWYVYICMYVRES